MTFHFSYYSLMFQHLTIQKKIPSDSVMLCSYFMALKFPLNFAVRTSVYGAFITAEYVQPHLCAKATITDNDIVKLTMRNASRNTVLGERPRSMLNQFAINDIRRKESVCNHMLKVLENGG